MKKYFKGVSSIYIQIRTRYNSRHPRPAPIDRQIFEIITKPIFKEQLEPDLTKSCSIMKYRKNESVNISGKISKNLYEEFLNKELTSLFNKHKMIICCHHDSMNIQRMFQIRNIFLFEQINITFYPSDVVRNTLKDTKWCNMIPLFTEHTAMLFCQEEKVLQLLNLAKKIGDINILGGLVGDRLYTKQGLIGLSKLLSTTDQLAGTVATLQQTALRTNNILAQHQQLLVYYLKKLLKK